MNRFFCITPRRKNLSLTMESWMGISVEDKYRELFLRAKQFKNCFGFANMVLFREIRFPISQKMKLEEIMALQSVLAKKFKIEVIQVKMDRNKNEAVLLTVWFDWETGRSFTFDRFRQKKLMAFVYRFLQLPHPKDKQFLRYFLIDHFEEEPEVFQKLTDKLQKAQLHSDEQILFEDILLYVEAMCEGFVK